MLFLVIDQHYEVLLAVVSVCHALIPFKQEGRANLRTLNDKLS